jgi:large repetitive protein
MKRFALLALVALAACNSGPDPVTKPIVEFTGFVNTLSGVTIPANSTTLPANFVAQVRSSVSSTADRVSDVQCFNGATPVTTGVSYKTLCGYAGVTSGAVIKATATSTGGVSEVSKTVTIDSTAPQASSILVGGTTFTNPTGTLSAIVTANSNVDLSVTSSDPDVLRTYIKIGTTVVAQTDTNTTSTTIGVGTAGGTVVFGIIDNAGNLTQYAVTLTINKVIGDGQAPTVSITSPANGATVNGTLTVTVNSADTSGIDTVELIANGNPIALSSGVPNPSFSVDTTKFSNGPFELKARATDKSGLSTTSSVVTVTINNVLGPILQITSPTNNATLSGATTVTVNILKRSSDYTYTSDLTVEFFDYRGTSIGKKIIALNGQTGATNNYTSDAFDLNNFPNDLYTIKASTIVNVTGEAAPRAVTDTITIKNINTNLTPPAAIIAHPIRIPSNQQQLDTGALPIFSQTFGYIIGNLSDDKGIVSTELRMTCISCGSLGPVNALEQYIAYIPPVTQTTALLGFDANGTPYLPDGIYTMRLVTQDTDGNRNIQEMKVKLSRNDPACPAPYTNPGRVLLTSPATPNTFNPAIIDGAISPGDKLSPGSASYTVNLIAGHEYRNGWWVSSPSNALSFAISGITGATTDGIGKTFNASGDWIFYGQLEDLTTNCVHNIKNGLPVIKTL